MHHQITIERTLRAPIEKVFAAFTDPDNVKQWHAPGDMSVDDVVMDHTVGGAYAITMRGLQGEPNTTRGKFLEIIYPTKIVFSWKWDSDPIDMPPTEVTVLLSQNEDNTNTTLTLTHRFFLSEEAKEAHEHGWQSVLTKLNNFLQSA